MSVADLRHLLSEELELMDVAERITVLAAGAVHAEGIAHLAAACAQTKRRDLDIVNMPDAVELAREADRDALDALREGEEARKLAAALILSIQRKRDTPFLTRWGNVIEANLRLLVAARCSAAAHLVRAEKAMDPKVLGADGKEAKP